MGFIAIHNSQRGFHPRWVTYCKEKGIPYKLVNCYSNEIIKELQGCQALMWHFNQSNPKDILFAKQLLFALQQMGIKVFPDFNTAWHFDDKVGQKYLLEIVGAPLVPTWVFYDKNEALQWVEHTNFPKVFKLRRGAGSQNVRLVKTRTEAKKLIQKAFRRGFSYYDPLCSLKERYRKYKEGLTSFTDILKGIGRIVIKPRYARVMGNEKGYIYFQEFIPDNDSDTRVIVIDEKAFALKRMVRKGDFRASGSGNFRYAREEFDERCLQLSFKLTEKLNAQCVAFDYVFDLNNNPLITEISYGFVKEVYDPCPGYWDKGLIWHEGKFNPYGWMVDIVNK